MSYSRNDYEGYRFNKATQRKFKYLRYFWTGTLLATSGALWILQLCFGFFAYDACTGDEYSSSLFCSSFHNAREDRHFRGSPCPVLSSNAVSDAVLLVPEVIYQ